MKAVLPVVGIVIVLSFTIAPITSSILLCFLVGAVMVMAGMMFFTLGAEMSMTPMGEKVGARMTQSKNILLIVVLSFLLGVVITISEPDLQVLAIHTTLCYGLQVILYPVFDSKNFPNEFVKYRPNHFSALSDHLKYLAESKKTQKMDLSFLISAGVGGDSLNTVMEEKVNGFLRQHHCSYEVCKGYGMTELAATAVISTPKANAIGSVGIPFVHNTVKIVDMDTNEELSYGKVGEILISSPSIMLGYYKNQEATQEIITLDETGKKWIRTGDLGYINKDGLLFHQGRIRRIYLTAVDGQPAKIFPNLVEEAIKSAAPVEDCTVVARCKQNSAYYEAVAYVILKDEAMTMDQVQCNDLFRRICKDKVPTYMCPVEYRYVKEFPHTPIGKVDFRKLEEMAALGR